jgi:inhibitor of KinA sporulation pathway (predicted exonuclease)
VKASPSKYAYREVNKSVTLRAELQYDRQAYREREKRFIKQVIDLKKMVAEEKAAQAKLKQKYEEELTRFQQSIMQQFNNELESRGAAFQARQQRELEDAKKSFMIELAKVQVNLMKCISCGN